jgi:hypothetical protein
MARLPRRWRRLSALAWVDDIRRYLRIRRM